MANKSSKKKSQKSPSSAGAKSTAQDKPVSAFKAAEKKAEQIVKASDKTKPDKTGDAKKGGVSRFFRELRSEFKKVVWPSRKTVINNTTVVLVLMVISAVMIFGIDTGFTFVLEKVVSLAGN